MKKELKISFEREEVLFHLGDEVFFMPKDRFLWLCNVRNIHNEFEANIRPEDQIDDLDRPEIVAQYHLLATKHGLPLSEAAKRMEIPEAKLKNWVSRHNGYITRMLKQKQSDIQALMNAYEADYSKFRKDG